MNTSPIHTIARFSLGFLWIFTAISSTFLSREIGYDVLANAGITGKLANTVIFSGSALDLLIGVWVISGFRLRDCYLVQLIVIIIFTVILTFIEPDFWIHPFGPLTKNVPLLVMIYYLYKMSGKRAQHFNNHRYFDSK